MTQLDSTHTPSARDQIVAYLKDKGSIDYDSEQTIATALDLEVDTVSKELDSLLEEGIIREDETEIKIIPDDAFVGVRANRVRSILRKLLESGGTVGREVNGASLAKALQVDRGTANDLLREMHRLGMIVRVCFPFKPISITLLPAGENWLYRAMAPVPVKAKVTRRAKASKATQPPSAVIAPKSDAPTPPTIDYRTLADSLLTRVASAINVDEAYKSEVDRLRHQLDELSATNIKLEATVSSQAGVIEQRDASLRTAVLQRQTDGQTIQTLRLELDALRQTSIPVAHDDIDRAIQAVAS